MAVPAFSFSSRAVPVAEIGRPEPSDPTAITWVDIGCDVHEITTDTGRGSASDRFVPGTAVITASNVSDWAGGTVPVDWSYFADDFARTGPALGSRWERWPLLEADHDADELVIVDEAAQVQGRPVPTTVLRDVVGGCELVDNSSAFGATATTATIGPFTAVAAGDLAVVALAIANEKPSSPVTIPGWTLLHPSLVNLLGTGWQYDIYLHRVTGEEAAVGDPWTATWTLPAPWTWVGWVVRGAAEVQLIGGSSLTFPSGTTGYYEARVYTTVTTDVAGCIAARVTAGNSHHNVVEGGITEFVQSTAWPSTQLLAFDSAGAGLDVGTVITHRTWNWTSAATVAGEWAVGNTLLFVPGPVPDPDSVPMQGASCALWGQDFDGDHFVDTFVIGLAAPDKVWPSASTTIELVLHANRSDLAAAVAIIEWLPSWDDPANTGRLNWTLVHRNTTGADTTLATGHIDFDADGFPEPARLRFEADTAGAYRFYFQGALTGSGTDTTPPTGDLVGVYAAYYAGALSYGRTHQPGPPRFENVSGGSNIPVPIYLEPGVLVRIGVDHQFFDIHWFFHGYVDAIVPVYDPTQRAVARIECIDALGEIGRMAVDDIGGYDPEETWERVTRLMDEAEWPAALRDIDDDATWMSNAATTPDRVVELLTQTAESCGGAVYGDPETGHVVFRGRDWQAWDPDLPPEGYITNLPTPFGEPPPFGALVACPSTWERSWRREEMTTRVTYMSAYGDKFSNSNPDAETRFGVEAYDRTLTATEPRIMRKLGNRQLKLRGPGAFPRVNAVLLDAATGDGAVDVMTLTTFTGPSRYQCGLRIDGMTVFDRQYLVSGLRHTITRDRWQCRLELDIADVFATKGARWGKGHWGVGVWGHSI